MLPLFQNTIEPRVILPLLATDAARAASDIVLTQEGLSTIIEGIIIARCIFQRMQNFIVYRISATLQLLVFFFIAGMCRVKRDGDL